MQSEAELNRRALRIAAQLVARYGDAFLPAFLRVEAEIEKGQGRNAALERAIALGGGNRRTYRAINASASARPASAPPSP